MMKTLRTPTWAEFVESFCPLVRELPPGEQPRDWANDGVEEVRNAERELPVGPVLANLPPVTGPQRYQLQFSTVEEHVQLVERAKALMARERPGVSLGELHLEAMTLLVASLEKRKFATGASSTSRQRGGDVPEPRQRGARPADPTAVLETSASSSVFAPLRQRSRYIPAALRREVYERDAGRCDYVDARGERCCETRYLELHHLKPFAQGGGHQASNLALRCAAHNRLAAEQDFGRRLMTAWSDGARHESLSRQRVNDPGPD
jgi:hypothetical protein